MTLSRGNYRRMLTLAIRNQKQGVLVGQNETTMKSWATGKKRKVWREKNDMKYGTIKYIYGDVIMIYIILDANFKNI